MLRTKQEYYCLSFFFLNCKGSAILSCFCSVFSSFWYCSILVCLYVRDINIDNRIVTGSSDTMFSVTMLYLQTSLHVVSLDINSQYACSLYHLLIVNVPNEFKTVFNTNCLGHLTALKDKRTNL